MRHFIFLILLCGFVGCSGGAMITGTVRFDDGTPVTKGSVVFDLDNNSFRGTITADGNYTSGGVKEKQAIPNGVYTVWLTGTEEREDKRDASGQLVDYTVTQHVASEYTSPSNSPLKFEVKSGERTFDIVVKRYKAGN
jgi:hypothetical protein